MIITVFVCLLFNCTAFASYPLGTLENPYYILGHKAYIANEGSYLYIHMPSGRDANIDLSASCSLVGEVTKDYSMVYDRYVLSAVSGGTYFYTFYYKINSSHGDYVKTMQSDILLDHALATDYKPDINVKQPDVQVYVGDNKLTESDPTSSDMTYCNTIEGFDSIKMFWVNQSTKNHNFTLYAIKKGWFGITSELKIDDITSYSDNYLYRLSDPNIEYTYKLLIEDESSPCMVSDGFTGKTRFFYFKFSSAVKPTVNITGVANGSVVSDAPVVSVVKANSVKQYQLRVNNNLIYTFSQNANETYTINKDIFNLGDNTVGVYDGITLVKSLKFTLKPSGTGTDGNGSTGGIDDDGIGQPREEYQPPAVDDKEKPTAPTTDEFSKWVLYYLQCIIYWLTLPFKLLANLLKDLCTNIIDFTSQFVTTYEKLMSATKVLFSFIPDTVWYVVKFGFALAIILWFFRGRK